MITLVKIKNWKSHRETELKFGDGTNVLVGMMGAGKSAVLDAITYALFGTLPAAKARRIKLEDLISSRPSPADWAEVEVSFKTAEGEDFRVKRRIERGKGTTLAELRKESGELIESGSSDRVTENVQAFLKIDYDLYERAIYSEQNRLDYFLTIQKGKRMESIDELLGINKLENARRGMGALANRLTEQAGDLEMRAKQLEQDESLAALPKIEQEIRDLELAASRNRGLLESMKKELDQVSSKYEEFRALERDISILNASYLQLSATASSMAEQVKKYLEELGPKSKLSLDELIQQSKVIEADYRANEASLQNLSSEYLSARVQLQSLEDAQKRLSSEIGKIEQELQQLQNLKKEIDVQKPREIEFQVTNIDEEHRKALSEHAAVNAKLNGLKEAAEDLSKAEAFCPVCESPLSEAKKSELLARRRGEMESLEQISRELSAQAQNVRQELEAKRQLLQKMLLVEKDVERLPGKETEYSKLREDLHVASQKIPDIRANLSGLEANVQRAKGETEKSQLEYLDSRQKIETRKNLDELEARFKGVEIERAATKQKLNGLRATYDESKFREIEQKKNSLSTEYGRMEQQIRGDIVLMEAKKTTVAEIRGKISTIKRFEVESKYLRTASQALGTIQNAITKTQAALRQQFLESVNVVMSDIWESIYPYRDFVSVRLTVEGTKGGDYTLQLRDHSGNWIPVEGVASGGERTDAVLALRIAFAMVLAPNLRWIVFDEPTHNLDAQGIEELAKIMRERLPEIVRQILLITHEERLEGAVSGYLYRFHRNKTVDEPTLIEQVSVPESYE